MSGITIVLRSPEDIQKIKELEEKIKKFEELPPLRNPEDLQKIKELEERARNNALEIKILDGKCTMLENQHLKDSSKIKKYESLHNDYDRYYQKNRYINYYKYK